MLLVARLRAEARRGWRCCHGEQQEGVRAANGGVEVVSRYQETDGQSEARAEGDGAQGIPGQLRLAGPGVGDRRDAGDQHGGLEETHTVLGRYVCIACMHACILVYVYMAGAWLAMDGVLFDLEDIGSII